MHEKHFFSVRKDGRLAHVPHPFEYSCNLVEKLHPLRQTILFSVKKIQVKPTYPHPFDYSYNLVMQGLNWAGAMLAKLGWAKQFVASVFHWTA